MEQPFSRGCQLCSYSRTYQHFMELKGSLPCSQEPDQSSPYHPNLSFKNSFCYYFPTYVLFFLVFVFLLLSHQYPICNPLLCHLCYKVCPFLSSLTWSFQWYLVKSTSYEALVNLSLLLPNILLNNLVSSTFSLCYSLDVRDQVSHPTEPQAKLYFCIF
jgi:hypothetical protein